jgi:FAD/FMN-containing dehydrogenase
VVSDVVTAAQEQGQEQHLGAVRRLQESYAAIAPGAPVRLAKQTTNLFRPRDAATGTGLDVSGLSGVISVDPVARTADVQGMCTYEDLVDATLPHGLIPFVVPQLRTITLGGAVTGLGIESTSFRNGLPHESVLEMDVITAITESREWEGEQVDGLDGVAFEPGRYVLTLARWTDEPGGPASDYTGQQVFWRSVEERSHDVLTTYDYLWRWDTDWFWCSGAFGAQHPLVRRVWPRRWRRSDVYQKLLGLDQRFGIADRLDRRAGRPQRERVVQDIEVPVERLGEFLDWFDQAIGMRPVWLCPLQARHDWPTYPLEPGRTYVNVGFWGTVHVGDDAPQSPRNRAIEEHVAALDGHKSLYSESFYDRDTFDRLYDGDNLAAVKQRYDPDGRLTTLYDKAVRRK